MTNRLLNFRQAGDIAGVSRTTVAKWVDEGHIKPWCDPRNGRRWIREKTLQEFLEDNEKDATNATFENVERG